ncbi:MAG: acyl-CoA dehydrogenase family protein [Pseudomonadota bacterium]
MTIDKSGGLSMLRRTLFEAEHEEYRSNVARFFRDEVMPHHERWEEQQHVDREIWTRAGELGLLCGTMPSEYGGADADRRYAVVMMEEQSKAGASGIGFSLHSDIVANYINNFGTEEQKQKWLPPMAKGELISAIAMTEPGTGSDLQSIKTKAVDAGDHYIVNGSKIFITNGYMCDFAVVAVKTGEKDEGAASVSLLIIEADREGFSKGKPLRKVGMHAQDTCELFFDEVRVPKENRLGEEGQGFVMLMEELAWERLMIAIISVAGAEGALQHTLDYTKDRKVFGKSVASFQNSRFKLAEMKSEITIGQVFCDRCMEDLLDGGLDANAAFAAKYWCSDMMGRVIDECVQLHGGYGYMLDYPVARAFIDARAQRIYGGTNEIMKDLIARSL